MLAGRASPRALRQALDAKVRGFVVKDAPPSQLADSIRRVAGGECVIDSALARRALADPDDRPHLTRGVYEPTALLR
jgi:two-component system response regulator DesR